MRSRLLLRKDKSWRVRLSRLLLRLTKKLLGKLNACTRRPCNKIATLFWLMQPQKLNKVCASWQNENIIYNNN